MILSTKRECPIYYSMSFKITSIAGRESCTVQTARRTSTLNESSTFSEINVMGLRVSKVLPKKYKRFSPPPPPSEEIPVYASDKKILDNIYLCMRVVHSKVGDYHRNRKCNDQYSSHSTQSSNKHSKIGFRNHISVSYRSHRYQGPP